MNINKYKVILWDFDGVIIDSDLIRVFGFKKVLDNYPENQVELLIDYHNRNGGLSRYVKFRYFFEKIRKESITDEKVNQLANLFSEIMKVKLVDSKLLINETIGFINSQFKLGKEMHIVSGSDQKELRGLCSQLGIDNFFISINGSPTPKTKLVENIIKNSNSSKSNYCLIGDAINDFDAAQQNEIKFYGYNNVSLKKLDGYINNFY
mgnify:CR=1 FL=1